MYAFTAAVAISQASLSLAAAIALRDDSSLTAPLEFTADGTFQISIFEDLHFGESRSYLVQPGLDSY